MATLDVRRRVYEVHAIAKETVIAVGYDDENHGEVVHHLVEDWRRLSICIVLSNVILWFSDTMEKNTGTVVVILDPVKKTTRTVVSPFPVTRYFSEILYTSPDEFAVVMTDCVYLVSYVDGELVSRALRPIAIGQGVIAILADTVVTTDGGSIIYSGERDTVQQQLRTFMMQVTPVSADTVAYTEVHGVPTIKVLEVRTRTTKTVPETASLWGCLPGDRLLLCDVPNCLVKVWSIREWKTVESFSFSEAKGFYLGMHSLKELHTEYDGDAFLRRLRTGAIRWACPEYLPVWESDREVLSAELLRLTDGLLLKDLTRMIARYF